MKTYKLKKVSICICTGVFMIFASCDDYLNVDPRDRVSDTSLWDIAENADLFLNQIYGSIQSPLTGSLSEDPRENFSDNGHNSIAGRYSRAFYALSAYTPNYQNTGSQKAHEWNQYENIRRCNLFIERVNESSLAADWKTLRLAEARFLRAFFYNLLYTAHGGVPLIEDVLNISEQGDGVFRERASADETAQFIIRELADIEDDLPLVPAEAGRVSKGAALALKGWIELFSASPLHNTTNDLTRWKNAADTYQKIMQLNRYTLFPDYFAMFLEENNYNSEVIFAIPSDPNTTIRNNRSYTAATNWAGTLRTGFSLSTPTQELVDEYCMENGLPITDPLSGYDPQNPYVGREKRFYESIVYDGCIWNGVEIIIRLGLGSSAQLDMGDAGSATNTGYYWRKMIDPRYSIIGNLNNRAHWTWFRYAEILLGYAEAQNEAVGPDASVYSAINQVRRRGELPLLPEGLGRDEMRHAIHRERRVELAFEDKRWYDLLRLRLAEEKLNQPLKAMKIERENGQWVYSLIPAPGGGRRFFPERNYFLPIPQAAIDRNPKLAQNPGYQ